MSLGQKIRQLRQQRGWSQAQLAMKSGLSRSHISLIEMRETVHPRTDALFKLARAFNIPVEELYEAAGYEVGKKGRKETPDEILERLKLAQPIAVPVYTTFPFHAGGLTEPVEYVYRGRASWAAAENIEGYIVEGNCLEPAIMDKDIIIVDRNAQIDADDIVACSAYEKLFIGRLKKIDDELWLINADGKIKYDNCQVAAAVIEIVRRLK